MSSRPFDRLRRGLRTGWLLSLGLAVVLGMGCRSAPAPRDHFYRIELRPPAAKRAETMIDGVLLVDRLEVEALTGGRPLIYRERMDSVEIRRHSYAVWADPPALMVQRAIADQLAAAGIAERVVLPTERVVPDATLRGRLLRLEHVPGERVAIVEIELWLVDSHSPRGDASGWSFRGRREVETVDGSAEAAVDAYRRALADLLDEMLVSLPLLPSFSPSSG